MGKKLFSKKAIAIATFIGGPIAAGYLMKQNYEAFSQADKGKQAFIISIFFTALLLVGYMAIPKEMLDQIPNMLVPTFYTIVVFMIVDKKQGAKLDKHKESGGVFHGVWIKLMH